MNTKVKVALIGHGNLGKWHGDKVLSLDNAELVGIVDISPEARSAAQARHSHIPIYSDIEQIVDKIDAALVVTPISTHCDLVNYLLDRNKHVFCEKALAEKYEQVLAIKNKVARTDLVLQVGHSERFCAILEERNRYPDFFERPSFIRINRYGPNRGREADVSVVEDLMIHDADLLLYLFHEMPESVMAYGYKIRSNKWDWVSANFYYASGRYAVVTVGKNHVMTERNMEITNDGGCLYLDFYRNELQFAAKDGANDAVVNKQKFEPRDHLLIEQRYFYASIMARTPPVIGVDDACRAGRLLDAVLTSLDKKDRIVIKK